MKWIQMSRQERIIEWRNPEKFSVLKTSEGGESQASVLSRLSDAGVPARACSSAFVGHYGVEVPRRYATQAGDVIFGR